MPLDVTVVKTLKQGENFPDLTKTDNIQSRTELTGIIKTYCSVFKVHGFRQEVYSNCGLEISNK